MRVVVIAGPNGAGKSTFAAEYLGGEGEGPPFVNGDDIAADLNPDDPGAVAALASRIALRRMDSFVADGADFAFESTLSGRAYAARLRRWQAGGYRVSIIYLRLGSPDQAVERVARRVREGGHDIPEAVVRRRFDRSWSNFVELYRDVADDWCVYDNSGRTPVLMARSPGWRGVRESRAGRYAASETTTSRRSTMATETPYRFPEGEPSHESILAALVRARERAMARVAATRRGEPVEAAEGSGDRRPKAGASVIAGGERDG